MRKNIKKLYSKMVDAKIGELVPTMLENGIEYNQTIKDVLNQQGYLKDIDFESFFDNRTCRSYIKKLKEIQPPKDIEHNVKIGDIFYNSWGWEQTNIDFYQVVAVTRKTVKMRQVASIKSVDARYGDRGTVLPAKDKFTSDKVITKKPYYSENSWRLSFTYGGGALWNGQPMYYSSYA